MTTIKQLHKLYSQYNKKYFDGRLPAEMAMSFVDMSQTDKGGLCTQYQEPGLIIHSIHFDSTFKEHDFILRWFLLHEMCHVALYPEQQDHGQRFDEEMMRLAFRGAFRGIW